MDGIIGLAFPLSVSLASAPSARAVLGHFAAALWRQEQLEQGEAGGRARAAAAAARRRIDSAVAAVAFWGRSGEAVSSGAKAKLVKSILCLPFVLLPPWVGVRRTLGRIRKFIGKVR